jgi:hypothetical protein
MVQVGRVRVFEELLTVFKSCVVFWNLKRLVAPVVFGALLILINSCVLNFVVQ